MLKRLYVSNFRCLDNFEFKPGAQASALLIGKNGSGKSTLPRALKLFQAIGRGANRVGALVSPDEFSLGRVDVPMRFEIEALVGHSTFLYAIALELPPKLKELRVLEERLVIDGEEIFSRSQAQVKLSKSLSSQAAFKIDWHFIALPMIAGVDVAERLDAWRTWLAQMVILAPMPPLMLAESHGESKWPLPDGSNFAEWLTGLLVERPDAYSHIVTYLKPIMPDFGGFKNLPSGKDRKSLVVWFEGAHAASGGSKFELNFAELSDGEKCTILCAVLIAANASYGPVFAFWDEPDNYLSLPEVSHFIHALRSAFEAQGQLIVTSHSAETIRSFSRENTFLMTRKSHLEPSLIRPLTDLPDDGDVVEAYLRGELEA